MRVLLSCLVVLALAGCGSPSEPPSEAATSAPPPAPHPAYTLTLRVSQETPDGPALSGVEVQAFPLDQDGRPGTGTARSTDGQGFVRFSFREPVRLAVRAASPGWSREGAVFEVGDRVQAVTPHVVSDRDAFLPLYRSQLRFTASTSLMTETVEVGANGSVRNPAAFVGLAFPEGLQEAYLQRLASAEVKVLWDDTATSRADLAAALAFDGAVWAQGETSGPGLLPGPREASLAWQAPYEGAAVDFAAAHLQAAAVLGSAVVGDVPVTVEVVLGLVGQEPPNLPPPCHSTQSCFVPTLPPLPPVTA